MAKTNFKKNGNGKKPSAPKMPGEWLYLNKEELPLRKIYERLRKSRRPSIGRQQVYLKFHCQRAVHWIWKI